MLGFLCTHMNERSKHGRAGNTSIRSLTRDRTKTGRRVAQQVYHRLAALEEGGLIIKPCIFLTFWCSSLSLIPAFGVRYHMQSALTSSKHAFRCIWFIMFPHPRYVNREGSRKEKQRVACCISYWDSIIGYRKVLPQKCSCVVDSVDYNEL